jgi:hypothetical protein
MPLRQYFVCLVVMVGMEILLLLGRHSGTRVFAWTLNLDR